MLSSSILGKAYYIWIQSETFYFLQTFFRTFSRAFSHSKVIHWFVKDSSVEPVFANSVIARVMKSIVDFIVSLLKRLCTWVSETSKGGVSSAFVKRFVKSSFLLNFETILGGLICLMFIIPHDYWANPYALIFALFLFVLYLFMVGSGKREILYVHDMGFPIFLFALTCVFSLAFSYDRSDSLRVLLFYITSLLFLYVITADITTRERMMKLIGFIYVTVIFTALYAIYQRHVGVAVNASLTDLTLNDGVPGRVYSTLGNPNNYAEFLVIMTPVAAVFASNVSSKRLRPWLCAGIVFPFIALVMTYSRSCWISMMLACIVFVYYANKKLIPAFFLLCVAAIPLLPNSVMVRIASLLNTKDSSDMFRVYVWTGTIKMTRDYFLTGLGLGPNSFAHIYPLYADPHALIGVPHSHMVYMELIIETGILGFISFMWYMLRLWKDAACSLLRTGNTKIKFVLIGCLASLIGIAFSFGVEYVWYYPRTFFAYFILAGIATAGINIVKCEKNGLSE